MYKVKNFENDHMIIETATINDAEPILELQKLAYQSEGQRYNDFTLPPLTQTFEEIKEDLEKGALYLELPWQLNQM